MADAAIAGLGLEFWRNKNLRDLEREKLEQSGEQFEKKLSSLESQFRQRIGEEQRQFDITGSRLDKALLLKQQIAQPGIQEGKRKQEIYEKELQQVEEFENIYNSDLSSEEKIKEYVKKPYLLDLYNESLKKKKETFTQILNFDALEGYSNAQIKGLQTGKARVDHTSITPKSKFENIQKVRQLLGLPPQSGTIILPNNGSGYTAYNVKGSDLGKNIDLFLMNFGDWKNISDNEEIFKTLQATISTVQAEFQQNPNKRWEVTIIPKQIMKDGVIIGWQPNVTIKPHKEFNWENMGLDSDQREQQAKNLREIEQIKASRKNKDEGIKDLRTKYYEMQKEFSQIQNAINSLESSILEAQDFKSQHNIGKSQTVIQYIQGKIGSSPDKTALPLFKDIADAYRITEESKTQTRLLFGPMNQLIKSIQRQDYWSEDLYKELLKNYQLLHNKALEKMKLYEEELNRHNVPLVGEPANPINTSTTKEDLEPIVNRLGGRINKGRIKPEELKILQDQFRKQSQ